MITMLDVHTSHVQWATYFVTCGVGTGFAINLPYTAVSTVLNEVDMVTGNGKLDRAFAIDTPAYLVFLALLQFAFQLGGAISLCVCQTLFIARLTSKVQSRLPDLSIEDVIHAGAYNLPLLTPTDADLLELRSAYEHAVADVFIFLLVANALAFLASFGFENKNVRKVEAEPKQPDSDGNEAAGIV